MKGWLSALWIQSSHHLLPRNVGNVNPQMPTTWPKKKCRCAKWRASFLFPTSLPLSKIFMVPFFTFKWPLDIYTKLIGLSKNFLGKQKIESIHRETNPQPHLHTPIVLFEFPKDRLFSDYGTYNCFQLAKQKVSKKVCFSQTTPKRETVWERS